MTISGEVGGDDPLYLDDLQVGQRFTSKTHVVDAVQIKAFARQFDPQPFHLDDDAAKDSLFSGLVASGWAHRRDHHAPVSREGITVSRRRRRRRRRVLLAKAHCRSKARSWKLYPRGLGRIAVSPEYEASRAISETKWCRS